MYQYLWKDYNFFANILKSVPDYFIIHFIFVVVLCAIVSCLCYRLSLHNCYIAYCTFKQLIADDTAIIAKTQEELQDMVSRLVDTGSKYGTEINIDKSQVMRVSRSNESLQIKVNN